MREKIAADVRPRREEQVLAGSVVGGVAEQAEQRRMRDDGSAVARLALGPT
jgi:hypothetical protein